LGPATIPSPLDGGLLTRYDSVHYVAETDRVLLDDTLDMAVRRGLPVNELPAFEPGGPRRLLFFEPPRTRVGIVTCGGLCPGLNNVVRGLVMELHGHYGVTSVTGFRNGYRGLTRAGGADTLPLTPQAVGGLTDQGGTVLGTSGGTRTRWRWSTPCSSTRSTSCSSSAATGRCAAPNGSPTRRRGGAPSWP
ncbi:MAG: 6-phosphofructokinase, partial [Modestobacter sp.]|nr:6-phosphofructokinase [Modestobacter sp.]